MPARQTVVSIVVPVHNGEAFLEDCLNSLLSQSHSAIEIILIDDGSTDSSPLLCSQFEKRDPRVRSFRTANKGPAAARNAGIERATGDFLFFMDCDDTVFPHAIQRLVEAQASSQADLVVGDFLIDRGQGARETNRFLYTKSETLSAIALTEAVRGYLENPTGYSLFIYVWGKLFRRVVLKEKQISFHLEMFIFEDTRFNFEFLLYAGHVAYVREHLYIYKVRPRASTLGSKVLDFPLGFLPALASISAFLAAREEDPEKIWALIGHATASFSIRVIHQLFAVRGKASYFRVYRIIREIVLAPTVQESLPLYQPRPEQSKLIPFFLRCRSPFWVFLSAYWRTR